MPLPVQAAVQPPDDLGAYRIFDCSAIPTPYQCHNVNANANANVDANVDANQQLNANRRASSRSSAADQQLNAKLQASSCFSFRAARADPALPYMASWHISPYGSAHISLSVQPTAS